MNCKRIALLSTLCGAVNLASATGQDYATKITAVDVRNNGYFLITLAATIGGTPPTCATNTTRMTADASTAGGKALLANAIAAMTTGATVYVDGDGLCTQYAGYEELSRVMAYPSP